MCFPFHGFLAACYAFLITPRQNCFTVFSRYHIYDIIQKMSSHNMFVLSIACLPGCMICLPNHAKTKLFTRVFRVTAYHLCDITQKLSSHMFVFCIQCLPGGMICVPYFTKTNLFDRVFAVTTRCMMSPNGFSFLYFPGCLICPPTYAKTNLFARVFPVIPCIR